MKTKSGRFFGFTVLALAAMFFLTGCGEPGDPTSPPGPAGQTVTYTGIANGETYTLVITENTARYAAQEGDTYELTVGSKKSTGTVNNVADGVLTLKPADNSLPSFTVAVSAGGILIELGEITWNNGTKTNPGRMAGAPTLRYATVPFTGSGGSNSVLARAAATVADNLILAAYDADSYYYLFLLGHINLVPLAYRQAVAYNGKTPVTIGYSATNVTETSITQSVAQATENSVTSTMTHGWEVGAEIGLSFIADSKATLKYTGSYSTEEMSSRSTENTYETANTKSSEITDEISLTIGDHDEPAGLYRYSLFTTTDVYYVLITDKNKTTVKKAYTALCARPTSYWALDYEPDLGGSFPKTAEGDLLEIPKQELADLAKLPEPTDNDLTPIPAQKAVTPVASKTEGSYETSVTVTLSSETSGAFIHYTTNGNTPTASSTLYSSPITITNTATLKAIAVSAGMDNSTIMTETYTITDPPLQTKWGFFRSGSGIVVKDEGRSHTDYIDLKVITAFKASEDGYNWDYGGFQNFDLTRLKAAGYTVIYIWLSYGAKPIDDGNIELSLRKGLTGSGTEWFSRSEDYPGYDWGNRAYDKRISIDDFSTEFTMTWSASGGSSDDWELGHRAVFFTALKE